MKELIILITALFLNEFKFSKADSPGNCAFNQGHHCGYNVFNTDWKWNIINNYNEFGDHTTNSTMSAFVAIDDNYKAKTTTARNFSPLLEATGPSQRCLTFWYRYVGKWIKRFSIVKQDNSATPTGGVVLWNITKRTSFTWNYAQVPISSNVSYVIHFEVERFNKTGNAINNFVDVDDIIFTQGPCIIQPDYAITNNTPQIPPKQTEELLPTPISDSPINCSFYANSLCTWIQAKNNSMNWTLQNGPARLSRYTGPKNDHTYGTLKGYYIYIDVREKYFGKAARLESDYVSEKEGNCLTFWYHMWGTNVNTLNLYTQVGNTSQLIWSRKNAQGMDWKRAMVSLQMSEKFKIVFEAIAHGSSSLCSIALDDISLSKEDCPVSEYYCDFEYKHLCDYKSSVGNMWSVTGGKHYSLNAPVAKDHSFNTDYGHYIALNASQLDMFNSIDLKSPVLTLNVTKCLKFWYYMKLATTTELYVITSYNLDRILYNSASFSTFYGNWQVAQVTLNSTTKSMPRVLFRTTIMSNKEFVAIDDIEIRDGACPSEGECNFENGNLCTWTNGDDDDFDWELQSGATASTGTGPLSDHTFGNNDGTYLYIETSLPQKFNEVARLYSHGFQQSAVPSKCLHFWYNMIGRAVGRLTVYQSIAGLNRTLWQLRGDQGYDGNSQWRYAQVSFSSNKASYQLMFEATVGGEFGDIAIDDIVITDDLCAMMPSNANKFVEPPTIPPPTTPSPEVKLYRLIDCYFNRDLCKWSNVNTSVYNNWIISNNSKTALNYLPTGMYYAFAQIDPFAPTKKDVRFTLQSPLVKTKSTDDNLCLNFNYYMFGINRDELTLYIDLYDDKIPITYTLWKKTKYSIDQWQVAAVSINMPNRTFRLRMEAVVSYSSVVAIQKFYLYENGCFILDEVCDFTMHSCGWQASNDSSVGWGLSRPLENPDGPAIDHTSLTSDGVFAFVQNDAVPAHGRFVSPQFSKYTGTQCFSFWYYMSGAGDGTLSVQLQYTAEDGNRTYSDILWQRIGDSGKRWHRGQITISRYEFFNVVFLANFSLSLLVSDNYMAVDDIEMIPKACDAEGSCDFDDDFCGFTNDIDEVADWMVGKGKTFQPRQIKGPVVDADGNGMYAYVDYTSGILFDQSETRLRSEAIRGTQNSQTFCLEFSYVKFGKTNSLLQILLNRLDFPDELEKTIWKTTQDTSITQYTHWNRANVVFNCSVEFEIIFQASDVESRSTFIGIDDVTINRNLDCKVPETNNNNTQVPNERFKCNFDDDNMCGWELSSKDTLYNGWHVSYGLNIKQSPGPNYDHTTKTEKGFYVVASDWYKERNNRMSTNETVKDNRPACFQFWHYGYNPYSEIHSLQIIIRTEDNNEMIIWNRTSTAGGAWQFSQIDIPRNTINYEIIIESTIKSGSYGYIAVDDVVLLMSECPEERICSFDNGMCGFSQPTTNTLYWSITTVNKLSNFPYDHTTNSKYGNYLYLNSSNRPSNPHATFVSPQILPGKHCIHFWYYTTSDDSELIIQKVTRDSSQDLINFGSIARKMWISASVEADNPTKFQITFTAIPGTKENNLDFAIDDIEFTNGSCKSRDFCDFEQDLCYWQTGDNGDFSWVRESGHNVNLKSNSQISSQLQDHTLGLPSGHFLVVNTLYENAGNTAELISPVITSDYNCFSFWYFSEKNNSGTISVLMHTTQTSHIIASVIPEKAKEWVQVKIDTNLTALPGNDFNYVLQLIFLNGINNGILALDDFFLDTKYCAFSEVNKPESVCNFTENINCGSCNFENGTCNYNDASANMYHWKLGNRTEANFFTEGDIDTVDHTKGTDTGQFMYAYVKGSPTTQLTAQLMSPRIEYTTSTCHMSFWLYTLPNDYSSDNDNFLTVAIAYLTGDEPLEIDRVQGVRGEWTLIPVYLGSIHQPFRFEFGMSGWHYEVESFAIDDIDMIDCGPQGIETETCNPDQIRCNDGPKSPCVNKSQECDFNNDCVNGKDEAQCGNYTMCDFEDNDLCIWQVAWQGWTTSKPSNTDKIVRDHTTNSREGTFLLSRYNNRKLSRIGSKTLKAGNCTMRFHYILSGSGNPQLKIVTMTTDGPEKVWFNRDRKWGNYFVRDEIQFNMKDDFMISLEANINSFYGYVAVDDISFAPNCVFAQKQIPSTKPSVCKEGQFRCDNSKCIDQTLVCNFEQNCKDGTDELDCGTCDFEQGQCGWSDSGVGIYRWKRVKAFYENQPSNSLIQDHTNNSLNGSFMSVVKTTNAHSALPNTYMESAVLGKTATKCKFSFAYHTSNDNGKFKVNVRNLGNDIEKTVAELADTGIHNWTVMTIPLGRLEPGYQIVFEVDMTQDHLNDTMPDFVVDDTQFIDCSAIAETTNLTYSNLSCNFENNNTCNWYQELVEDELDWKITSAGRKNGIGPNFDQTSENKGNFLHIPYENVDYPYGRSAWLVSPVLPAVNKQTCLSFSYHMFGLKVGAMGVVVISEIDNIDDNYVWTKYDSQGNTWQKALVNIEKQPANYRLMIMGSTDTNNPRVIAIDDIAYSNSSCRSDTYEYNFETTNVDWVHNFSNTYSKWKVIRADDNYRVVDHTTGTQNGHALYFNAPEEFSFGIVNNTKQFRSSWNKGSCFQFWYMMTDESSINIAVRATYGNIELNKVYTSYNAYEWHFGQIAIPKNTTFQINFRATTLFFSHLYQSIYLDDFVIRNETCLPDGSCDFESTTCGWTPYYSNQRLKWLRSSAETPSKLSGPSVDNTKGTKDGFYMFLDSSLEMYGSAGIRSPELRSENNTACFSFVYHMTGQNIGELNTASLSVSAILKNDDEIDLFNVDQYKENKWIPAYIEIHNLTDIFFILIMGDMKSGPNSDIAIDDLSVTPGKCPQEMVKPIIITTTTEKPKSTSAGPVKPKTSSTEKSKTSTTLIPSLPSKSTFPISTDVIPIIRKSTTNKELSTKETKKSTTFPTVCASTEISCNNDGTDCIKSLYWCDGRKDCSNGKDEENCSKRKCSDGTFSCATEPEKCIENSTLCDGKKNCIDGSDESQCECFQDLCLNSAECNKTQNLAVCQCVNNYHGNRCQYAEALEEEPTKSNLGWVAGVVLAILLAIAVTIAIYFKKFRHPDDHDGSATTIDNPAYDFANEATPDYHSDPDTTVPDPFSDPSDNAGIVNPLYK